MSARPVGVLGGGRWGLALACAARNAGNSVLLCTRRDGSKPTDGVETTGEIRELGDRTRLILVAVPSVVARAVATTLGDVVDGSHMIVHGVRGLSDEGLLPLSEIVRQETPVRRVGALGGPVLAEDLLEGVPSSMAAASRYPEVLESVQRALGSQTLRVTESPDITGLEWASALVGALMVALGYARAAGITAGLLAGLMTRAVHEAAMIGMAAGADERTFYGIAGFGDLMAAVAREDRPEVRFGRLLAEGQSANAARNAVGFRVEAMDLVPQVLEFAREHGLEVPVFTALKAVLEGKADKSTVLPKLMAASPRSRAARA